MKTKHDVICYVVCKFNKTYSFMKDLKILFFVIMCTIANVSFAIEVPSEVSDAFKKVCPNVTDAAWSSDDGYYVATFTQNEFETKLWFDAQGNWVMEQIDWQTLSEAPSAIFNAFSQGQYASNEVQDVVKVQYPEQATLIAVLVGMPNEENGYMLLYNENGELIDSNELANFNNCLGACYMLQADSNQ